MVSIAQIAEQIQRAVKEMRENISQDLQDRLDFLFLFLFFEMKKHSHATTSPRLRAFPRH